MSYQGGLCFKVHNHYPGYNRHKDLERPGKGQLEQDCKKLLMKQESSFLVTLAALIEAVAIGQDL